MHITLATLLLLGAIASIEAYSITHVANGYHDPIFVKVDTERAHIESINADANLGADGVFSAGGSYSVEQTWNKFIEVGFAEVIPREYGRFSPEGKTVYITIWTAHKGYIWSNVPQREDISFIVKSNSAVVRSKYGTIWEDTSGVNHKPTQSEVDSRAAAAEAARSAATNHGISYCAVVFELCFIFFSLKQLI